MRIKFSAWIPFDQLWKSVQTGDPDTQEYCSGGARVLFWMGCLYLAGFMFISGLAFLETPNVGALLREALRSKDYREVLAYYLLALPASIFAIELFVGGVWMIFGRTHVLLERSKKLITKEYRLRSFCLFSKSYQLENSSSFFLRRKPRFFLFLHLLRVKNKSNRRGWLLFFPSKYSQESWVMAEQMAGFMGIPLEESFS